MDNLSNELYLHILCYLSETDGLEWCGCNRRWYDEILRGHIRTCRFTFTSNTTEGDIAHWFERLQQVIRKPSNQVEIQVALFDGPVSGPHRKVPIFNRLFPLLNYIVRKAYFLLDAFEMVSFLEQKEPIQMKELELHYRFATIAQDALIKSLQRISALQILSIDMESSDYQVPHISSLKDLTIKNSTFPQPIHRSYVSHLEKLELVNCNISDVSMLGYIPDLSLNRCEKVTDISALKHNRRVAIFKCSGVRDFSQSFEESEVILIDSAYASVLKLHSENWRNVKSLTIITMAKFKQSIDIPSTVVKCHLEADFPGFNLSLSPNHALKELMIAESYNQNITSLENLGWERLVVVELSGLSKLSSLQGLGTGKNQKVIIRNCPLITDYSPLRYVHEVEICNAERVQLDELDHVHTLVIKGKELVITPNGSYDHIYQLDIQSVGIHSFQGLQKLPIVMLSLKTMKLLEDYLEVIMGSPTGENSLGKLWNQRIDFIFQRNDESEVVTRIRLFYHRFLKSHYFFLDNPKKIGSYDFRVSLLRKDDI